MPVISWITPTCENSDHAGCGSNTGPEWVASIVNAIAVTINGVALAPSAILYAGLSPGSAGLYQINIVLPPNAGTDPAVQVSMGGQPSAAGCKLAVQ